MSSGAKALAISLSAHSCLTSLDISQNAILDDGCEALAGALKSNRSIYIHQPEFPHFNQGMWTHGLYKHQSEQLNLLNTCLLRRLEQLGLHQCMFGDKGATALAAALDSKNK